MNFEIVGIQQKRGEYQGRTYDNTIIHTLGSHVGVIGKQAGTVKMKTAVFQGILSNCKCTPDGLIGKIADITFDRYGNLEYFELLSSSEK